MKALKSKLFFFLVLACFAWGSAAWGKDVKVGFIYVGPVGDGGWTYAHDQGRKHLEKMGVETTYVESVPESDSEKSIRNLARKGYNLIFTTSFGYMDPTLKVAKKFPDTVFMHATGFKTADNMGNYFARMYQARYLVGMVAGAMSKTGIIGVIGSHPIPEILRHINAITLGARSVNPKAVVKVIWVNSWFDPAKEAAGTKSLIDGGADVLTITTDSAAGTQTAAKYGKYSLGNDSDMSIYGKEAHLTANIYNWGVYYEHVYKQVRDGKWKPDSEWWGIETGAIDLAPFGDMVPQSVQDMVMKKKQEMIDKKFVVFEGPIKKQDGSIAVAAGQKLTDSEMLSMKYFVEGVEGVIPK
ncbi:MAG: BMP family ABC transporter substrate-binding protein [SAR324 cluster bacterium]|nr:BMP family ABC transporter substrate-binding protein [SAR324 cluster bacterium]